MTFAWERTAMRTVFAVVGGLSLLLAAAPVRAHHAFASEFDSTRPVKLTGTVTQMDWTNPHAWIHIDVKTPDGKIEKWDIEGGAPNALLRRGWTKKTLPVGMEIMITGYASR